MGPGPGGDAWGYRLEGAERASISGNVVASPVTGGGSSYADLRGMGVGFSLDGSQQATIVDRLLVHGLRGGEGVVVRGVEVTGSAQGILRRVTVTDLAGHADSTGLYVGPNQTALVVDSILATTGRWAVFSDPGNGAQAAEVRRSVIWLPEADGDVSNVTVAGDVVREDPLFVLPVGADFHLGDGSPGVDVGSLQCADEPVCDGEAACESDLGFYAGTGEASCE